MIFRLVGLLYFIAMHRICIAAGAIISAGADLGFSEGRD